MDRSTTGPVHDTQLSKIYKVIYEVYVYVIYFRCIYEKYIKVV